MRAYRLLLRLYPASFRADHGAEMTAILHDQWRAAGAAARIGLCISIVREVIMNAPAVHWDILKQDLRQTARTLRRSPGFALTAILVTALGVGANTAAFSVADFVLLRPLPFPQPDRLVQLCEGPRTGGGWGCMNQLSPANYRDFKSMSSSFESMGAFTVANTNLVGAGEPRHLGISAVTPEVLPVLGVTPAIGRVFDAREDDRRAVVLSDGLWRSQFSGDRSVVGQRIMLDGGAYTVIGVMPPAFYFPSREVQ
jgi:hypothetical protein